MHSDAASRRVNVLLTDFKVVRISDDLSHGAEVKCSRSQFAKIASKAIVLGRLSHGSCSRVDDLRNE